MHPYVLVPLLSGLAAAMVASAILTRDSRHPAHRLTAAILGCAAYWSLLEVVWNSLDDPFWVARLVRLSSLGWMPLGVLCFHLFLEVGRPSRLRRLLPALYAVVAVSIGFYVATPWGIESALRTSWGWSFRFGPLFVYQYLAVAGLATASLAVLWRRVYPSQSPAGERRQGYWAFAAVGVPLATASTTDALLPLLDFHVPRLGSASMTLVGAAVAWSVHRYGYSVLAPGTLAPQILAALPDGVALLRRDGVIRSANASLARLCGCEARELVGRSISDLLPELPQQPGEVRALECKLLSRDSQPIEVSLTSSALRDRQGEPAGRVISVRDVREVVAMRSRLVMAGRLAAVGELAAGIAHEINNPAAFVKSNVQQLRAHWSDLGKRILDAQEDASIQAVLEEGEELISESLAGVDRIAAIVQDVRSFAQPGHEGTREVDLNVLLEETLRIAETRIRYGACIERDFAELPSIRCNPQELKQVFLNMLFNASHAVDEGGGTIRVQTRAEEEAVEVRIEDDGCGMTPEIRERIFDPFFTTRSGDGSGLGLALSYQIVRRHGGSLEVDSEPGRGTRLRIRLPSLQTS